ncbi:MAG TPA: phosphate ABC transporter permease PstA [Gaiellales bacterium]
MSNTNGGNPFNKGGDNLRRRRTRSKIAEIVTLCATLVAVAMLVVIVASVFLKGASALNWDFFTKNAAVYGATGGGIANAIVGTAVLVLVATLMAVPVGILVAIYLGEFARPVVATPLRVALDVFTGIPSIVIGIFVFALLVVGNGQSGWAGAFALALIMLPYIARGTDEVLGLTARTTREGSLALGASRAYTVVHATLPTALGGIVTSTVLAIARVAGETAPLLFASSIAANIVSGNPSHPLNSIPLTIFTYSESPSPEQHAQAWAAALTLIVFVLLISVLARVGSARYMRRLRG